MEKKKRKIWQLMVCLLCICVLLVVLWGALDFPSFSARGAVRRACRENLVQPFEISTVVTSDGWESVLGIRDRKVYEAAVRRYEFGRWNVPFLWRHGARIYGFDGADDVYFSPLRTYGVYLDAGEFAVFAEGERAELTLQMDGRDYPMVPYGSQDGWFLFQFDREADKGEDTVYRRFYQCCGWNRLGNIESTELELKEFLPCSFVFRSYDGSGKLMREAVKTFE